MQLRESGKSFIHLGIFHLCFHCVTSSVLSANLTTTQCNPLTPLVHRPQALTSFPQCPVTFSLANDGLIFHCFLCITRKGSLAFRNPRTSYLSSGKASSFLSQAGEKGKQLAHHSQVSSLIQYSQEDPEPEYF